MTSTIFLNYKDEDKDKVQKILYMWHIFEKQGVQVSISDGLVHIGNELHNNTVNTEYSYRERLDMGEFVETVELVTTEMSRVDDSVLFGSR